MPPDWDREHGRYSAAEVGDDPILGHAFEAVPLAVAALPERKRNRQLFARERDLMVAVATSIGRDMTTTHCPTDDLLVAPIEAVAADRLLVPGAWCCRDRRRPGSRSLISVRSPVPDVHRLIGTRAHDRRTSPHHRSRTGRRHRRGTDCAWWHGIRRVVPPAKPHIEALGGACEGEIDVPAFVFLVQPEIHRLVHGRCRRHMDPVFRQALPDDVIGVVDRAQIDAVGNARNGQPRRPAHEFLNVRLDQAVGFGGGGADKGDHGDSSSGAKGGSVARSWRSPHPQRFWSPAATCVGFGFGESRARSGSR